jgi:hypothetical protein
MTNDAKDVSHKEVRSVWLQLAAVVGIGTDYAGELT